MNSFIYGLGILTLSFLSGQILGEFLGQLIGVQANVGGVGFSMLILIFLKNLLEKTLHFGENYSSGISFWNNLYVPIVIAMSASQNVKVAISSGLIAILAGIIPSILIFFLIPVLVKLNKTSL
jgi:malonate transporter MadL subunit